MGLLSKGGVVGAAVSLAVTTMGAGILTLPSAFGNAAIIPAMVALVLVGYATVVSIDYIVLCIEKLGLNSYEEITRELLGGFHEEVVRWTLIVYNIGSAVGYLVIIGDLFEPLQPHITRYVPFLTSPKESLFAFWLVVVLPLSCVPNVTSLHMMSTVAIAATCVISLMVVFRFFVPVPVDGFGAEETIYDRLSQALWLRGTNPLLAMPIMMFSFDCQALVYQIYSNLDDMSRDTMRRVAVLSLIVSGAAHAAVGLFGYLANPTNIRDNIMNNYNPNTDPLFAVGYAIYALPVNLAFVLILFPTRDSIFFLWYGFSSATAGVGSPTVPAKTLYKELAQLEKERKVAQGLDGHCQCSRDVVCTPLAVEVGESVPLLATGEPLTAPNPRQTGTCGAGMCAGYGTVSVTMACNGTHDLASKPNGFTPAKLWPVGKSGTDGSASGVHELTGTQSPSMASSGPRVASGVNHGVPGCSTCRDSGELSHGWEPRQDAPSDLSDVCEYAMDTDAMPLRSLEKGSRPPPLPLPMKLEEGPSTLSSTTSTTKMVVATIPLKDHLIVSVLLSTVSIAVALVTPGIVSIVALMGGLCSSLLCYTYPAAYRIRMHNLGIEPCADWLSWMGMYAMLTTGVAGGILGTGVALIHFFQ